MNDKKVNCFRLNCLLQISKGKINSKKDNNSAGLQFLPGSMLLIRAGLGMSVLDWTIKTFNCQVSANWNLFSLEGAKVVGLDDY
ncbi:unnamed protein product [Prunus armeniaca]